MTSITIDDSPLNLTGSGGSDKRVTAGTTTTITIRSQQMEYNLDKTLKDIPIPKVYTSDDAPETKILDLKRMKITYTITGYIDDTSSKYVADSGGTTYSSSARTVADDLIKMAKEGGVVQLTWGTKTTDVNFLKMQIKEVTMDEDTPTKYAVIISLIEGENL